MGLQKKITLLIVVIMIFTLGTAAFFSIAKMEEIIKRQMAMDAMDIANTVASMREVQDYIGQNNGNNHIQSKIENIRLKTRVQFITVMDMEAVRYSHPIPDNVGKKFQGGDEGRVLSYGESYVTEGEGSLGKSLRAFAPIYKEGEQIGAVCVGILNGWISEEFKVLIYEFIPYICIAVFVGIIGAALLSRNIKKSIYGLEPKEIGWLLGEREAILESMNEGIIAINNQGELTLINKTAKDILNLKGDYIGRDIESMKYKGRLLEVLKEGKALINIEEKPKKGVTVLSNYSPLLDVTGRQLGVLVSFQNLTKVKEMAEELTGIKKLTYSLRAQNHEFMNKLHTISGLIQLEEYNKALEYIYETTSIRKQVMGVLSNNIKPMALAALLLAKYNKASEAKIDFKIEDGCKLNSLPQTISSDDLCCIVGNLIENSIDAVIGKKAAYIRLNILEREEDILIEIKNNGEPIPSHIGDKIYEKGISTKEANEERGYGLYNIKRILEDIKGSITYESNEETIFKVLIPKEERI